MNKTNIVLILLATTALLSGMNHFITSEKSQTFLSTSLQAYQDPCGTIVYRSKEDFDKLLNNFKDAQGILLKVQVIRDEVGKAPGVFSSQQAISLIKAAGDDMNLRIEVLYNIINYIIYFQSEEVIDIIQSTNGGQMEKLEFLKKLAPFIKDPTDKNKEKIVNIFSGFLNRMAAQEYLKDAKGVECLWGGIPEKVATFVIDVSGSMDTKFTIGEKTMTRLDYVKQSLKKTISQQLKEYQKFNVVSFSTSSKKWKSDNVAATQENIKSALEYVDSLRSGGGTNISGALEAAFTTKEDLRGVYLLSDGYPNYGVQSPAHVPSFVEKLEKPRKEPVVINTISFMLGDNVSSAEIQKGKEFLEAIAIASKGSFKQMINQE